MILIGLDVSYLKLPGADTNTDTQPQNSITPRSNPLAVATTPPLLVDFVGSFFFDSSRHPSMANY